MTFDDLMRKVLDIFPNATLDEDNYGQIVIYTDLMETKDGEVVPFTESFGEDDN